MEIWFLLGVKVWWYNHKSIPYVKSPLSVDNSYLQERSGIMKGVVGGFEFQKDIAGKKHDATFYMNFSLTEFTGKTTVYPSEPGKIYSNQLLGYNFTNHPVHENISTICFNFAVGFKFDLNKRK
jgi:hypothetical protein